MTSGASRRSRAPTALGINVATALSVPASATGYWEGRGGEGRGGKGREGKGKEGEGRGGKGREGKGRGGEGRGGEGRGGEGRGGEGRGGEGRKGGGEGSEGEGRGGEGRGGEGRGEKGRGGKGRGGGGREGRGGEGRGEKGREGEDLYLPMHLYMYMFTCTPVGSSVFNASVTTNLTLLSDLSSTVGKSKEEHPVDPTKPNDHPVLKVWCVVLL